MEVNTRCPFDFQCEDCLYNKNIYCSLIMREEESNIQEIADKLEKEDIQQTIHDAEVLAKEKEERELTESEAFWSWWGRTSPPDSLKQRDPINAMSGALEFGGGSKSGKRKKAVKKNDPFAYLRAEI